VNNVSLSIIIVNYNTRVILDECLGSIFKNPFHGNFDVIVVDNASKDESLELVREKYPQVKTIKNEKNLGFAKATNVGIKISRGSYVLLLNSDAEVLDDSLNKMFDYMETNPSVGIVGPKLIGAAGKIIQMSWGWSPTILKELLQKTFMPEHIAKYKFLQLVVKFLERKQREVELVSGACMFIRREVLDIVGLLDENLFLYFEEPDFCIRVRRGGWKVIFLPSAEIMHKLGQTMARVGKETLVIYRSSQLYFYKKNNSKLQQKLLGLFLLLKFSYLKLVKPENTDFYDKVLDILHKFENKNLN